MKKIIFGIMFLILVNSVFAAEMDLDTLNKELAGKTIPKPVDKLFGDERINIHFGLENGEKAILGLITENGKFKSLTVGKLKKVSLNVYTSEKVVKEIESAEDSAKALKEAFDKKEIRYKAVGIFNKIKFSVLSMIIKIGGGFSEEVAIEETEKEDVAEEKEEIKEEADEEETTENKETTEDTESSEEKEETNDEDVTDTEEEETEGNALTGAVTAEPTGPVTHIVELIDGGFDRDSITIKVGDTVEWHNMRAGFRMEKAMLVGAQLCNKLKSTIYMPGDLYSWTFDEARTCVIVDAIFSTQTMKVIVEE